VADPGSATLVIEHVARRRVAVPGGQPDIAPADLSELGRTRLEESPFQLVELLVIGELEAEVDGAAAVVHGCIVNAGGGAMVTTPGVPPGTLRA
jgi:hypothetical protein